MTEETGKFETDRLEVGANTDIINATAADLGIRATELRKVLAELLPYVAAEGKIATLKVLEAYLKLSTKLAKTASEIIQGKNELTSTHGQGVNITLVRYANHIEEAITGGHLLKEGEIDSHMLDNMRPESIDALITLIGRETEASEESGLYGRIVRKERAFEKEYREKAAELVAAAEEFERENPDFIAALTGALGDNSPERVFELMADPSTVSHADEPTGTASIRTMTTGRKENPIDGLINLVRDLELLDRLARKRANADINTALEKHNVKTKLSDTMNRALSSKFGVLLDRVPSVTRREEIAKERTLHEGQIGVLEEIKEFLDMRPRAIQAQHAVVISGLAGLLDNNYRRQAVTTHGSATPTAFAQDETVLKTISGEITQLEDDTLPALKEALDNRLEEIRGILPDVRFDRMEVSASIHNFRQLIFAALALAFAGVFTFATAPDGLDETAVQAAATAGHQRGFSEGTTAGLAEGAAAGSQAALTNLTAQLGLTDLGDNPTVDSLAAALTATDKASDLEDRRKDLQTLIDFLIEKNIYTDQETVYAVAAIVNIDSLNTDEQVTAAKKALFEDLVRRASKGDSAGPAFRILSDLRELSPASKDVVTATLEAEGRKDSVRILRSQ